MIELVYDPFDLWAEGHDLVVESPPTRRQAYAAIDSRLRENPCTDDTLTIIVAPAYWRQFTSAYRSVLRVSLREVTPSSLLSERGYRTPPKWLDDQLIHDLKLDVEPRAMSSNESWPKWVVESFFPLLDTAIYVDWLRAAYACEEFSRPLPNEIMAFLLSRVRLLLHDTSLDDAATEQVMRIVETFSCLHEAIEALLASPAVRPLLDQRPISNLAFDRLLAEKLPLVFPLPAVLHQKVSALFCAELKSQRIDGNSLTSTVLLLNADWDDVSDELAVWLRQKPTSLSKKAAQHLLQLPAQETNNGLQYLVALFAPTAPPNTTWNGLAESEEWNREYCRYLRSAFSRRQLPEAWELDPARIFTEWMQSESVLLYNNQDKSFVKASRAVHSALSQKQTVILCVLDAFAYHVEDILTKRFSDALGHQPTSHESIFAPVPTITKVAKMSVATGLPPNQCPSEWEAGLCQVYSLQPDELLLAREWVDIERVQPMRKHRLIVYLDNRIDNALQSQRDYSALRDDIDDLAADIAKRMRRWVDDLEHVQGRKPSVFVTADHGFTFGPPSCRDGMTADAIGHHRSSPIDANATLQAPDHLARLDKDAYHLPVSYLAATKRGRSKDTISGWVMQHGGLLPEEVIIPLIRWFGSEQSIQFADVTIQDKAEMVNGHWKLVVRIRNRSGVQIDQTQISLCLEGQGLKTQCVRVLKPDEDRLLTFSLSPDLSAADDIEELKVAIHQSVAGHDAPKQTVTVGIHRVLMQPDDEFENMF